MIWITKDGRRLQLHEMTDNHLMNAICLTERRFRNGLSVAKHTNILAQLRAEQKRREDASR